MINNKYPNISPSLNLDFTNSNTIDPRVTFSRASAATYYEGKTVAKAEENLLTYSQEFASWGTPGIGQCSVTSDVAVAPDGTMTADLLLTNTSTAGYRVRSSANAVTTSAGIILSFYVKPAGYNFVSIVLSNNFGRATIDVTSGAITNYGTNAFSVVSTTLVGGWYRVVLSASASVTAAPLWLGPNSAQRDPSDAWAGDGTSGVYLWGAQLEQRSQVTAYTPTTSTPITNYIPVLQTALSGVPRIDHDPVTGECKGLLIEEQRTNLLTYSEQFDNAAWSKGSATVSANSVVAPDGSLGADMVSASASSGGVYTSFAGSAVSYTYSVFAKKGTSDSLYVKANNAGQIAYYVFNLSAGTFAAASGAGSATMAPVGNGWYRVSVTPANVASGTSYFEILSSTTGTFYLWGAQVEAGAFPTSYIPTTTAQVTRAADSASMTGANFSSWYRQDEGSLLVSYNTGPAAKDSRQVAISADGDTSNLIQLGLSSASIVFCEGFSNGSAQFNFTQAVAIPNTVMNAAVGYANNSAFGSHLGSSAVTDTNCIPPYGVNRLDIGNRGGGSQANTSIRRLTYYPKRLTDAQLQALTA